MPETVYSREVADHILKRISEGESLRSICRDAGMPSEGTVRGWSREDRDGFAARYRLARDLQLDCWSDQIVDIADEANLDPRDRQVRIETRKWIMSKLAPRRYGDRLLVAGEAENPVRILHEQANLDALSDEQVDLLERFAQATLAKRGAS
jgi:hypothetical protein